MIAREAVLLELCKTYNKRVMIFFKTKTLCHAVAIIFGLLDMKCKELHSNLSQTERIDAIEQFRSGNVDFLLSTDLASRGIDIKQVRKNQRSWVIRSSPI